MIGSAAATSPRAGLPASRSPDARRPRSRSGDGGSRAARHAAPPGLLGRRLQAPARPSLANGMPSRFAGRPALQQFAVVLVALLTQRHRLRQRLRCRRPAARSWRLRSRLPRAIGCGAGSYLHFARGRAAPRRSGHPRSPRRRPPQASAPPPRAAVAFARRAGRGGAAAARPHRSSRVRPRPRLLTGSSACFACRRRLAGLVQLQASARPAGPRAARPARRRRRRRRRRARSSSPSGSGTACLATAGLSATSSFFFLLFLPGQRRGLDRARRRRLAGAIGAQPLQAEVRRDQRIVAAPTMTCMP